MCYESLCNSDKPPLETFGSTITWCPNKRIRRRKIWPDDVLQCLLDKLVQKPAKGYFYTMKPQNNSVNMKKRTGFIHELIIKVATILAKGQIKR